MHSEDDIGVEAVFLEISAFHGDVERPRSASPGRIVDRHLLEMRRLGKRAGKNQRWQQNSRKTQRRVVINHADNKKCIAPMLPIARVVQFRARTGQLRRETGICSAPGLAGGENRGS